MTLDYFQMFHSLEWRMIILRIKVWKFQEVFRNVNLSIMYH